MPDQSLPLWRRGRVQLTAAALLAVGGAAGAAIAVHEHPSVTMAPIAPVAIRSLADNGTVSIRGRVAEVYGNKFIVADATGRALVDTGRAGEDAALVSAGQPILVQGRFRHGFLAAAFLVGPGNRVTALHPPGEGHHGYGPHGPGRDQDGRDGAGPPMPR